MTAVLGSGAGDEGDDDVGGVAVEVLAAAVVDRGRAWVGVAGGELHVAQRYASIECGHDERSSEHVGVDVTETGPLADRLDPSVRGRKVEPLAVRTYWAGFESILPSMWANRYRPHTVASLRSIVEAASPRCSM